MVYIIQCCNRVASPRNTANPTISWKAVSNGPAVVAGSNPKRFETMGITVPMNPAVSIEQVIATPITTPKGKCFAQIAPTAPRISPHAIAIRKEVAASFFRDTQIFLRAPRGCRGPGP